MYRHNAATDPLAVDATAPLTALSATLSAPAAKISDVKLTKQVIEMKTRLHQQYRYSQATKVSLEMLPHATFDAKLKDAFGADYFEHLYAKSRATVKDLKKVALQPAIYDYCFKYEAAVDLAWAYQLLCTYFTVATDLSVFKTVRDMYADEPRSLRPAFFKMVTTSGFPGNTCRVMTSLTIDELRSVWHCGTDLHVMVESLNYRMDFDGERYFTGHWDIPKTCIKGDIVDNKFHEWYSKYRDTM